MASGVFQFVCASTPGFFAVGLPSHLRLGYPPDTARSSGRPRRNPGGQTVPAAVSPAFAIFFANYLN